jgi:ankyrin repeat protein
MNSFLLGSKLNFQTSLFTAQVPNLSMSPPSPIVEVVQALIAAGADVNKANNDGRTPISVASQKGHLEVVQALSAAGADVNISISIGISIGGERAAGHEARRGGSRCATDNE